LFAEDLVFLKEIFDDKLLLTVHPASQHRQKEKNLGFQAGYARRSQAAGKKSRIMFPHHPGWRVGCNLHVATAVNHPAHEDH